MFPKVLYECSELPKALSFVNVIMKMDDYVLKSPHLRCDKHNVIQTMLVCSEHNYLFTKNAVLNEYY
jgi:hypothetical protein